MSTSKPPSGPNAATDKDVQAPLVRLHCPTPLHALRTLFLGHIASPRLDVSAMAPVAQAWGGELPEFASSAEVEEVVRVLVHGLWTRRSEHQQARNPFRLPRFEVPSTRQSLHGLARMRAQELTGFVDGLFGPQDELLFPQKAHEAVVVLAQLHAVFDGAAALLADATKPAPADELKALLRNLQQMTIVADEQINKAVQSCKRARGQRRLLAAGVGLGDSCKRARGQRLETMATAMSRKIAAAGVDDIDGYGMNDSDDNAESDFIDSPLSQRVTRNGVEVRVEI